MRRPPLTWPVRRILHCACSFSVSVNYFNSCLLVFVRVGCCSVHCVLSGRPEHGVPGVPGKPGVPGVPGGLRRRPDPGQHIVLSFTITVSTKQGGPASQATPRLGRHRDLRTDRYRRPSGTVQGAKGAHGVHRWLRVQYLPLSARNPAPAGWQITCPTSAPHTTSRHVPRRDFSFPRWTGARGGFGNKVCRRGQTAHARRTK